MIQPVTYSGTLGSRYDRCWLLEAWHHVGMEASGWWLAGPAMLLHVAWKIHVGRMIESIRHHRRLRYAEKLHVRLVGIQLSALMMCAILLCSNLDGFNFCRESLRILDL